MGGFGDVGVLGDLKGDACRDLAGEDLGDMEGRESLLGLEGLMTGESYVPRPWPPEARELERPGFKAIYLASREASGEKGAYCGPPDNDSRLEEPADDFVRQCVSSPRARSMVELSRCISCLFASSRSASTNYCEAYRYLHAPGVLRVLQGESLHSRVTHESRVS